MTGLPAVDKRKSLRQGKINAGVFRTAFGLWHPVSQVGAMWKMAGAAGLEPVTSAVTGQRSNQLSYAPAMGLGKLEDALDSVKRLRRKINSGSRRQGGGGGEPR